MRSEGLDFFIGCDPIQIFGNQKSYLMQIKAFSDRMVNMIRSKFL
jgi:hypothetical protein